MPFRLASIYKTPAKSGFPVTLEEFLSDLPEGISDVDAEMAADTYHEMYKADARKLFRDIADFLEACANLAGADHQSLGMMKFMLECRLEQLNARDDDLWALEALPINGPVN